MSTNTSTYTRTYNVVYARGAVHIQGLDEQVRGGLDSLNYALTACPALSKNQTFWVYALTTSDLAEAVKKATALAESGQVKGFCKKCRNTAVAVLQEEAAKMEEARQEAARTAEYPGEWHEEIPEPDGTVSWSFSTEYNDRAEQYFAEITGEMPFTWTVGECTRGDRVLETGEADTLEEAQRAAQRAFGEVVGSTTAGLVGKLREFYDTAPFQSDTDAEAFRQILAYAARLVDPDAI
jgi:bacterioferritin-associated ferredoxin